MNVLKYFLLISAFLTYVNAFAGSNDPFKASHLDLKVRCGEDVIIQNMPRVRSQDSMPICGAMAAATIAQFQICKQKKIADCSAISPTIEVSPFSTVAWARTNTGFGVPESQNHSNINIYNGRGGAAVDILRNAKKEASFMAESCFPLDQVARSVHDKLASSVRQKIMTQAQAALKAEQEIKEIFLAIDRHYNLYLKQSQAQSGIQNDRINKKSPMTEASFCEECLVKSVQDLGLEKTFAELEEGMDPSFNSYQFLYNTVFGKCWDFMKIRPRPQYDSFPRRDAEAKTKSDGRKLGRDFSYEGLMKKVKSVLQAGNPLAFDGICIQYEGKKCRLMHSVVIAGYRKVCKEGCNGKCKDVLKIQNSWGADWQKNNNDGWVDADALFSYETENPEDMEHSLSWYF